MNIRDVRASLYNFIVNRSIESGIWADPDAITILPTRTAVPRDRPIWVVEYVPGLGREKITTSMGRINARFNVQFLSNSFDQAEAMMARIDDALVARNFKITGMLYDFQFPQPVVQAVEGEGTLPAGTYHVAVSGLGIIGDDETLVSTPISVKLANPGKIRLIIPRWPEGINWYRKYNIYVGSTAAGIQKVVGSPWNAADIVTTVVNLDEPITMAGNPLTQSRVRYRFITVQEGSLSPVVMNDPGVESEKYMGYTPMNLTAYSVPVRTNQGQPLEQIQYTSYIKDDPDQEDIPVVYPAEE